MDEGIRNRMKLAAAMRDAGQIAYEVIGSRRNNEEDSHRDNYYHWKIKLICAVCKHIRKEEWPTGWNGRKNYCIDNGVDCEACGTDLVIRRHTDMWVREAKQGNVLAHAILKHYPR